MDTWRRVLGISGVVLMSFFFCQPHIQAQEVDQEKIPPMDQNVTKSFETATFGLG